MSLLAKLTSISTQTLSLLLERQRLPNATSLHIPQIVRNMQQMQAGILEMEENDGSSEASKLLRNQYERMRGMLGPEGDIAGVQRLEEPPQELLDTSENASTSSIRSSKSSSPSPPIPPKGRESEPEYAPYTDDPEAGYHSSDMLIQTQRQMMDEQDVHLDRLSYSINRQRDLSLQINDELDVHTGLLEGLDHELDRTDSRLTRARRKLDRVARGAKENGMY
ncbi:Syntaxin-52 [Grifola frondosa]|uniref:Syntaxin-52 n=1 Tax=Grifola frondosa TaxID=5627 RepID=A0A1C7MPN2_GRIFR|nr:Syntaxin-52 [Grifola frondosa]